MAQPDVFAPIDDLGAHDALESWRWLVGSKAEVRLLTAMGDLFVLKTVGWFGKQEVCLVDTYSGELRVVEANWESFKKRVASPDVEVSEWMKFDLLCDLHAAGFTLKRGECFSPTVPPVLGGKFELSNFSSTSWLVHVDISGQIHQQVKDLPPGTPIRGIDVKWE